MESESPMLAVTKKSALIFADLSPLVGECTTWSTTALCSKPKNACMREPRAKNCQSYLFHRALGCASLLSRVCFCRLLIGDSSFHIQGRQCGIVWLRVAHPVPHEHPNQAKHNEKNKSQTKYLRKTFRQMYLWPHQLQKTNDKSSNQFAAWINVNVRQTLTQQRLLFLSFIFCNWWGQRYIWRNVFLKYFVWDWWAGNKELWWNPSQDRLKVIFEKNKGQNFEKSYTS